MGFSDSDSDSDGDEEESVQSDQSMHSDDANQEGEEDGNREILSSDNVKDEQKAPMGQAEGEDLIMDAARIPVFAYHVLETSDISPIPHEMINIFTARDDLFWILQNDLLVKWFNCKKHSSSLLSGHGHSLPTTSVNNSQQPPLAFPSSVAMNLYRMVYSSEELVMSVKASETMSLLYKECSAEVNILYIVVFLCLLCL
jgi:hypothetical protein